MMEVKNLLLEEVRNRLYGRLKDTASAIVKEVIQKEIAHRVSRQVGYRNLSYRQSSDVLNCDVYKLEVQIPRAMREEVIRYKHQIMEVKVSLHNS
jgi:hypothetical protein